MTGMHAVSPLLKAERDIQTINVSLDQFNTSEVVRPQGLPTIATPFGSKPSS